MNEEALALGYRYDESGYIKSLEDGNYEAIEFFLIEGFDPNLRITMNENPLIVIAKHKSIDLIDLLLKYGADINGSGFYDNTVLCEFIDTESKDILLHLIEKGANINCGTGMPLFIAVNENNYEITKLLLENGANPNGGFHGDPIIEAIKNNNLEITKLLIKYKANVNVASHEEGDNTTALGFAVLNNSNEIVEYLLKNGADLTMPNNIPLICTAIDHKNYDITKLLIDYNAEINNMPEGWQTNPLLKACYKGLLDFVVILVENGADVNYHNTVTGQNPTPLSTASVNGNIEVLYYLIKEGAQLNRVDTERELLIAVENNNYETVKFLLENGTDVNIKDDNRRTALDIAINEKNDDLIELLKSYAS